MNLEELQRLEEGATPGPWKVAVTEYPHKLGGRHIERRIFTAWDHPQLKGAVGVVNVSYGLGEKEGDAVKVFCHIDPEDAAFIAAMRDAAPKLIAVAKAWENLRARVETYEVESAKSHRLAEMDEALRNALEELK